MSNIRTQKLKKLMETVRKIVDSDKNQKKAESWVQNDSTARDHWRGTPKNSKDLEKIPFTVEPEIPMWAEILKFNIKEFYTNPRIYLENQLKMAIYRHENFDDYTVIEKDIPIWFGTSFESSLFGAETIYSSTASPWVAKKPIFADKSQVKFSDYPDFYDSGLMPLAHKFYTELNEMVDDDFNVIFPEWGRGPFGVATHLRGYENILMDLVSDPQFSHELLAYITESRKKWVKERAEFLNEPIPKGNLYNDEVNTPSISPGLAEEFVLRYEKDLSSFHNGIMYWHSCGNTTDLLEVIEQLPDLEMFHIGPWTEISKANKIFGDKCALEICLDPFSDVQTAKPKQMREKLEYIIKECAGSSYTIRADGFHVRKSLSQELNIIYQWIDIAKNTC